MAIKLGDTSNSVEMRAVREYFSRQNGGQPPSIEDIQDWILASTTEQRLAILDVFAAVSVESAAKTPERSVASDQCAPKNMTLLLYIALGKKDRKAVLGDLEEEFPAVVEKLGLTRAKLWYSAQVVRSVWPVIGARLLKALAGVPKMLRIFVDMWHRLS